MRDLSAVAEGFFKSCEDAFATIVPRDFEPTFASEFAHFTEIGSVVGHEPENTIRTKSSADLTEEFFLKNPPTGVPAFGPRVGKIEMKDRHARYWQGLQGLGSQALNGGGIVQSEPEGAGVAFVHAVGLLFDPKKIGCGMERSHADQKGTTMAAEVDF